MTTLKPKELIAKRIALMFKDGDLVNLGAGVPGLVAQFLPEGVNVWLHSENGMIGSGPPAPVGQEDPFYVDASKQLCTILPGGSVFDSGLSFGIIRGGHLDYTVLGALQVDIKGNLANWMVPNGPLPGMGGAMDLVTGAKKVVVATTHTSKNGSSKIMENCTFPLTGVKVVNYIVTELAVIEITSEGAILLETAPGISVDKVINCTDAPLIIPEKVPEMAI